VFIAQGLLVLFWIALLLQHKLKVAHTVVSWVNKRALFIAALTATFAMAGSLFMSEVMLWTPCLYCWYQRIAIFPQVFLLWPAWRQKFKNIIWYSLPLAIIGLIIAVYHWTLQLTPGDFATKCVTAGGVSCVGRYIYTGPLTIAGMATTALLIIITLVVLQYKKGNKK
jgi:disulfide bond formation protein DsbB